MSGGTMSFSEIIIYTFLITGTIAMGFFDILFIRYTTCILIKALKEKNGDRRGAIDENDVQLREYTIMCEGKENGQAVMADKAELYIRTILKEKYGVEVEE